MVRDLFNYSCRLHVNSSSHMKIILAAKVSKDVFRVVSDIEDGVFSTKT